MSKMNDEQRAEFSAWLKAEGFNVPMLPNPETLLRAPDSTTRAQRMWLRDFVARLGK